MIITSFVRRFTPIRRRLISTCIPEIKQAALEIQPSQPQLLLVNPQHTYTLQSKGYSKLNADGTGIGIVLFSSQQQQQQQQQKITARQYFPRDRALSMAEYSALILGLQYATQLGIQHIVLETDHTVLAKQLQGIFPMEKRIMKPLYWQVMHIVEEQLKSFQVRIVSQVDEATELAKRALATNKSSCMPVVWEDPMKRQQFVSQGKQRKAIHNNNNKQQQQQQATTNTIDPQRTYVLQFDGGARGNPAAKSGCGMVLYDDQNQEVWCGWKFLQSPPLMSNNNNNNMTEYHSILLGLLCAKSLGIQRIHAQGDSELVVKQLNGLYQVRDLQLKELWEPTRRVMNEFEQIEISHIGREFNKRADWLANHAMDTETSFGFEEY